MAKQLAKTELLKNDETVEKKLLKKRMRSRFAPLFKLAENAEDLGSADLAENFHHYHYGGSKGR